MLQHGLKVNVTALCTEKKNRKQTKIFFLTDFVIGRDVVLAELELMSELLDSLPHKAQFGRKNLMGHVWDKAKEHGMKNLFHSLRERAQENPKTLTVEYTCLDVSYDAIVLGTNVGVIFLYDRTCRRLSRVPSEVCVSLN